MLAISLRAALLAALVATGVEAKTLRYAYQNDANSLDPYALNETFTHSFVANVYEPLIERDEQLKLIPALATEWTAVSPELWRFKLRPNVKFHDGTPFTADDVVFSFERAVAPGSDVSSKVAAVKEVKIVDPLTVEFVMKVANPIFPQEITTWFMMSRAWAAKHGATQPTSVRAKTENYSTNNANGTGPFRIRERQQDNRTVFVPNPDWWGTPRHNLTEVIFTPIRTDATRVAALLGGEVDMIYPVPLQDVPRINAQAGTRVMQGPELRTIFLGFDQWRDELLESNIKGRNPIKDRRVRQALYQAIDIEAIKSRIMRGASTPAALMVAPGINGFDASLNQRLPFDPEGARRLLAEAGYADGFEIGMDCPNDRYVNDEEICTAIVTMLARANVRVKLLAQTRTKYFEKILSFRTSFYLLAWQPSTYDSLSALFTVMSTPERYLKEAGKTAPLAGQGTYNPGGYSNPRFDELAAQVRIENDPVKRQALISEAFRIHKQDIGNIPLHQQALAWGVRGHVKPVQRADDALVLNWVRVD